MTLFHSILALLTLYAGEKQLRNTGRLLCSAFFSRQYQQITRNSRTWVANSNWNL